MYYGYGYYFDWYYIPILFAVLFSIWTSIQVRSTFRRYSQVRNRRGVTGADAARAVLSANGVAGVRIERISGELTDHYDPKANVIRLSADVYDSPTPAAVGVAAHEAGHAVQYAVGYGPIKLRAAIIPAVNFGSKLSMPLLLVGLLLMSFTRYAELRMVFYYVALAGVLCFGLCVFFQLVTLPTEFNASRRAMQAIRTTSLLDGEECAAARKTLTAAALTYVAAMTVSLLQFLRLLSMFSRRRD